MHSYVITDSSIYSSVNDICSSILRCDPYCINRGPSHAIKPQNIWLWTKWVNPPPTITLNIPRTITPTSNNLNYYTPQRVPQSNFSKTVKIAVKRHHTSTHFGDISTHSNLKQLNLTWHTGWTKIWTTFFGHSPNNMPKTWIMHPVLSNLPNIMDLGPVLYEKYTREFMALLQHYRIYIQFLI